MMEFKFRRGDRVCKSTGYIFEGLVNGSFEYFGKDQVFVNVQHPDGWIMHFRESDLELVMQAEQTA